VAPDDSYIATGSLDQTVRIWDSDTGAQLGQFTPETAPIYRVAVVRDGSHLFSSSYKSVSLWELAPQKQIFQLDPTGSIGSAAVTADGTRVVMGSMDGHVSTWDTSSRAKLTQFKMQGDQIVDLKVTPDGSRIITTLYNQTVRIWDAKSGHQLKELQKHMSTAVTPDGMYVISQFKNGIIEIFKTDLLKTTGRIKGMNQFLHSAVVINDVYLVTNSDNGVQLWDLAAGHEIAHLESASSMPSIAATHDHSRIILAYEDSTVRIWPLLPSGQNLIDEVKTTVPRCLTKQERERYHLSPEPPPWCYTKWPYSRDEN
jgi:WD40 repeat protein